MVRLRICSRPTAFLPSWTREQVYCRNGRALAQDNTRADLTRGTGALFFSSVPDGDIVPVLAALVIYNGYNRGHNQDGGEIAGVSYLPPEELVPDRAWKFSDVVPVGGRVIIERLQGWKSLLANPDASIRVLINHGVVAISDHRDDGVLKLAKFEELVREREKAVGGFKGVCGLGSCQTVSHFRIRIILKCAVCELRESWSQ